jgi:hypothetical protein
LNLFDFPYFSSELLGYVRKTAPSDEDYNLILESIKFTELIIPKNESYDTLNILYFNCDFIMLEYFFNKYKTCKDSKYLVRYEFLFRKIKERYADFYDEMIKNQIREKYSDVIYDTIICQENLLKDLVSISTNKTSCHKKIVFCYKYLVEGWTSKNILKKLRKKELFKLFSNFQTEYAEQSEVELPLVILYLEPLEDELYKSEKIYTKMNKFFVSINMSQFFKLDRQCKRTFKNTLYKSRINNIDVWCTRILERMKTDIIKNFRKMF